MGRGSIVVLPSLLLFLLSLPVFLLLLSFVLIGYFFINACPFLPHSPLYISLGCLKHIHQSLPIKHRDQTKARFLRRSSPSSTRPSSTTPPVTAGLR